MGGVNHRKMAELRNMFLYLNHRPIPRSPDEAKQIGLALLMVGYRRNFLPGGTYFFTVVLADRKATTLVDEIPALRTAFRAARQERPFAIDAIVVLPDHLHAIFTLPDGDADFPGRWRRIKK